MRAVPGPGQQGQAEGEGDGYSKRHTLPDCSGLGENAVRRPHAAPRSRSV